MKGIILAGGKATRLRPLTKVTTKQLLPVYDKPMIYYPIETLIGAGIKDILIIAAPEHAGHLMTFLGSGKDLNARFSYKLQIEPGDRPKALLVGKNLIGRNK